MSRVTLASLREEITKLDAYTTSLHVENGAVTQKYEASKSALDISQKARKAAEAEVLRLRMLASEMRGFIMAHHATEHPFGGQKLYKEAYSNEEENIVEMPDIRFPFMDADIG